MSRDLDFFMKRMLYLILLFVTFASLGIGFADLPNPAPRKHDVEIQGAKIISEGGYLWFHVTNHEQVQLHVEVHYPNDIYVIKEISGPVTLDMNESADFFFQVPYIWTGITAYGDISELRFYFEIYSLYRTTKIGTEEVEFVVQAVPLHKGIDNRDLFYLTIFVSIVIVASAVLILAKTTRPRALTHMDHARAKNNPTQARAS